MDEAEQRSARVRGALHSEVARVSELLRSLEDEHRAGGPRAGDRGAPGVGGWTGGDVAVHLSQVWIGLPGLARGDLSEVDAVVPGRSGGASLVRTFDELGTFTADAVRGDPERDLAVLAERIEDRSAAYLAACAGQDPREPRAWILDGVTVPTSLLSAHLLNETVVHGYDVARAAGRPWRIDPIHAGLVVDEFLMRLFAAVAATGGSMPGRRPPPGAVRGVCELRVRGGGTHRFRLRGTAALDDGEGRPDCHVSVDPAALLLVFYRRAGMAAAVARGAFTVWGRRPWLAAALVGALPAP